MKKVIVYPGRFQPMLSHHAEVVKQLQAKYPGVEVYVGTSDKVEPGKSPFNFKEKKLIASAQGIDPNKVLFAKRPYVWEDYAGYFDADNTEIFFAVGEKDMQEDPRFAFPNIDDKTGLNLKKNGEPSYYQMINTYKKDPRPMSQRGYIIQAPTVMSASDDVASASAFRNALLNAPDKETAKEIFNKQFREYSESVFDLVYDKITGDKKMSEDLNILRQLAGLSVSEDAPVEFDTPLKPEKIKFAPVSKSSAVMSIANRFPAGAKVNDPEVKKEEFLKALLKSPASLLSEINERIMPDENGLEVSKKFSEIIDSIGPDGLMGLGKDDKEFVLKIVKVAIKKMKLEAGDDRDFDPESGALENVDLSDIRSDYGIKEGFPYQDQDLLNPEKPTSPDYDNVGRTLHGFTQKFYKNVLRFFNFKKSSVADIDELVHEINNQGGFGFVVRDFNEFALGKGPSNAELNQDIDPKHFKAFIEKVIKGQPGSNLTRAFTIKGKDIIANYAHDESGKRYDPTEDQFSDKFDRERAVQRWRDSQGVEEALKKNSKGYLVYSNGNPLSFSDWKYENQKEGGEGSEQAYKKYLELVKEEDISEGGDCYHCDGTDPDCKECGGTGYVQFDDDPQEPSQEEIDKHYGKKEESAPFGEPSQQDMMADKLMSAYEKGEEELAKEMGLSLEELDQEMTEYAMDHNLHMDDDRDEVVQGYIEDVVNSADYKDHGEYESIEEGAGEYSYTLEYNGEENGMSKHKLTITSPEGETKEVADDFTYFDVEGDELQAELESWFHKGMGVADASVNEAKCGCCGNDPCDCPKDCEGCRKDEAVEDTTAKALEAAMAELRTLAGI